MNRAAFGCDRLTFQIVLLQAMKEEPAADAKCKDKFLVQSVLVSPDLEYANVTSIVCGPFTCYHSGVPNEPIV